jgi:hypothetical protein
MVDLPEVVNGDNPPRQQNSAGVSETPIAETAPNPDDDIFDDPKTVAAELDITVCTLKQWRYKGVGPPYVQLSKQVIRYPRGPRRKWLRERRVDPGAQASAGLKEQAEATTP